LIKSGVAATVLEHKAVDIASPRKRRRLTTSKSGGTTRWPPTATWWRSGSAPGRPTSC